MFATTLAEWCGRRLEEIHRLPAEAGHDVGATEAGTRVEIQVTELVTRRAVRDYGGGAVGWNVGDFDDLLVKATLRKVERYGSTQQSRLMLLVYSVDPGALEFCEFGRNDPETGRQELHVPEPLDIARRYLTENGAGPFDEVWFAAPSPDWAQISPVFRPPLYDSARAVHPPVLSRSVCPEEVSVGSLEETSSSHRDQEEH